MLPYIGYLIGYHGRTIRGFETNSGAKIDILSPKSSNDETPVLLSGTSDSVRNVLRMIIDLYHLNNLSSEFWKHLRKNHTGGDETDGQPQIYGHEEMQVKTSYLSMAQKIIPHLQEDIGVHVDVGKEREDQPGSVSLGVVGTASQCYEAMEELRESYQSFLDDEQGLDPFSSEAETMSKCRRYLEASDNYQEKVCLPLVNSVKVSLTTEALQPICKLNSVMMETLNDATEILICGSEINVKRAKLQLLHTYSDETIVVE